jgi:hypothetical protein
MNQYRYSGLERKMNFASRDAVLEVAATLALRVPGSFIEFGVADGDSARVLARVKGNRKFFALDSFEGLPEKFENAEIGSFACKPPRIRGVEIVKGYFEASLTPDLSRRVGRVAFAHLDADLFSSTMSALNWLTPLLDTGSILLFDEFLGGNGAEKRAFEEWCLSRKLQTLMVAEFVRDPSGFANGVTDVRVIFQIVGESNLPLLRVPTPMSTRVGRHLRALLSR